MKLQLQLQHVRGHGLVKLQLQLKHAPIGAYVLCKMCCGQHMAVVHCARAAHASLSNVVGLHVHIAHMGLLLKAKRMIHGTYAVARQQHGLPTLLWVRPMPYAPYVGQCTMLLGWGALGWPT